MANPAGTFDLNTLLTSTLGQIQSDAGVARALTVANSKLQSAAQRQITDAKAAADAESNLVRIQQEDKLRQENQYLAIANRLGTNPDLAGSTIQQLTEVALQASKEQVALRQVIADKQSINFLDNPMGYLVSRLTVNSDIERHNAAVDTKNAATGQIDWLQKTTKEQFATATAMTQTVNDQTIRASQVVAAYKFNKEATQAAMQASRDGIQNLLAVRAIDKDSLMLAYQGNNAINQQKAYQVQLDHLRISREQFNLATQAHQEKLNEDSLALKYVQKGFMNLTGSPMPEQSARDALTALKMKNPQYLAFFNSGMESYMANPSGSQTVYSLSPSIALDMYATGMLTNVAESQKQVFNKLAEWKREFQNPATQNSLGIDPKDKKAQEAAFNSFIQGKVNADASTPGSVFAPAGIKDTVKFDPKLAQTPLWIKVLEPATKVGSDLNDPNIMSNLIQSAMVEGRLSYADALDAPAFWAKGLELKAGSQNLTAFGIAKPAKYTVPLEMPLSIGRTPVNVLDRLEWARFINSSASKGTVNRMTMGRAEQPFGLN